jgi:hypothetical protein
MAEEKKVITLDDFEQRLMVSGLMDFRNDLLKEEKPTEDINDLILKVIDAPTKKKNGDLTVKNDKLSKQNIVLYFFGIIPVVWLGLLIAPCMDNGLVSLIQKFGTVMQNPFHIQLL